MTAPVKPQPCEHPGIHWPNGEDALARCRTCDVMITCDHHQSAALDGCERCPSMLDIELCKAGML